MLRMDAALKTFSRLKPVLLTDLTGFKEREHLQAAICGSAAEFFEELEEKLLVLGTEIRPSDAVGDKIDILALDEYGASVIIELKLGSNKYQLLQALGYAAMVSKWGVGDAFLEKVKTRIPAHYDAVAKHAQTVDKELNREQRIILIAEAYDYEVLATAEWLNEPYDVNIACYRITVGHHEGHGHYVSCTKIFPAPELEDLATLRGKKKITDGMPTNWDAVLARCQNPDVVKFSRERLEQNQRRNPKGNAFAYPKTGSIHWFMEIRRTCAFVYQVGRFQFGGELDESFWKRNLKDPDLGYRKNGTCLRFYLNTKPDLEFFQHTMENDAGKFSWNTSTLSDGLAAGGPEQVTLN